MLKERAGSQARRSAARDPATVLSELIKTLCSASLREDPCRAEQPYLSVRLTVCVLPVVRRLGPRSRREAGVVTAGEQMGRDRFPGRIGIQ